MRWNVGLLSGCWGLVTTCNLILVTISALVGYQLAEDKALATLPAALMWFGTALATTPASFLMQRIGRRAGFMIAAAIGAIGALVAALAVVWGSFALLCVGVGTFGGFNAFNYYYRFAAAESATDAFRSRAISLVLAGGVVSAIIGPELAKWSRELIDGYEYVGSFGVIIGFATIAFFAISRLDMPRPAAVALRGGRALRVIARQPTYLVAVSGGVIAYGVMALMMTITAVAMAGAHHPFEDAAFVIQWHVLGMFVPSFFTGHLIGRFGVLNVMIWGAVLLLVCLGVGYAGLAVTHFWVALTLLGIGWNFLFVGATMLLTECYTVAERAKAQAANEFMIFGVAGVATFLSGNLYHHFGWDALNLLAIMPVLAVLGATLWLARRRRIAYAMGSAAD